MEVFIANTARAANDNLLKVDIYVYYIYRAYMYSFVPLQKEVDRAITRLQTQQSNLLAVNKETVRTCLISVFICETLSSAGVKAETNIRIVLSLEYLICNDSLNDLQ